MCQAPFELASNWSASLDPPGFIEEVANLAIEKSKEARAVDVRSILFNFFNTDLDKALWNQLLVCYKPLFEEHLFDLSEINRAKILKLYEDLDDSWNVGSSVESAIIDTNKKLNEGNDSECSRDNSMITVR